MARESRGSRLATPIASSTLLGEVETGQRITAAAFRVSGRNE